MPDTPDSEVSSPNATSRSAPDHGERPTLPRDAATEGAASESGSQRIRFRDLPHGSGERILLVDDEETVRRVTCRLLEKLGYEVIPAHDGHRALEIFSDDDEVALVLTDVVMPGITGIELARRIRALDPDQSILFTSGYTTREYGKAPDDPPQPFMPKPFSMADLAYAVRNALQS